MKRNVAWLLAAALLIGAAPAPPPEVASAPVALLVDHGSGQVLFAREADRPFLPASMTKAMSALVAFDLIRIGRLREDAEVVVPPDLAARWSGKGTTLYLKPGDRITIGQLLQGLVTVSANDAAEVLAASIPAGRGTWISLMNARARQLGMTGSRFATPSGWPDGGQTRVTAHDMVRLGVALVGEHPDLYHRYFGKRTIEWQGRDFHSHDPFADTVPGADGIKTGHTGEAGFNFIGSVERDGRRMLVVVAGTPSETARAAAAKSLVEWGYSAWESRPLLGAGQLVGEAQVQGGAARSVGLAALWPTTVTVPRGTGAGRPAARIVYTGPLRAPLRKGEVVARLELASADGARWSVPLAATRDVAVAGPFDRVVNALLGLFA